jgi:hypothetical protein
LIDVQQKTEYTIKIIIQIELQNCRTAELRSLGTVQERKNLEMSLTIRERRIHISGAKSEARGDLSVLSFVMIAPVENRHSIT